MLNTVGKSPHIWDTQVHQHPEYCVNGSNGDIACDSYHKYKEDVQMCKDLGVSFLKLSKFAFSTYTVLSLLLYLS